MGRFCRFLNYIKEDHRSTVIYATFAVAKRKPAKGAYTYITAMIFPSHNSSRRSSHISFSYIHNFITIFSGVYNEPI